MKEQIPTETHDGKEQGRSPKHESMTLQQNPENVSGPQTIQILVSNISQHTTSLQVKPSLTVSQLKDMLQVREGIPVNCQRLRFCSKEMNDKCTLKEYGVGQGSTIGMLLKVRCTESFLIKTYNREVWIPYDPQMTIGKIKAHLAQSGGAIDEITLCIGSYEPSDDVQLSRLKESGGFLTFMAEWKSINLVIRKSNFSEERVKVRPSEIIEKFIEASCKDKGLNPNQYRLVLQGNIVLPPKSSFGVIEHINGKTLHLLHHFEMIVRVITLFSGAVLIEAPRESTIEQFKELVRRKTKVAASRQIIMLENHRELKNSDILAEFTSDYLQVYLVERLMYRN